MSVASRAAAGWVARVAAAIAHGGDRAEIIQSMVPYASGEDYRTLNRVYELGRQAHIAAQRLQQQQAGQQAPVVGIPNPFGAQAGYRYVVVASYQGSAGGVPRVVTLQVDSPFQMSTQMLQAQATAVGPGQTASSLTGRSGFTPGETWTLSSVVVQSIERR